MSKQLMRSGTAIEAMSREAQHAESKADFIHKFEIAQKEANETLYWLNCFVHATALISIHTNRYQESVRLYSKY